MKKEEIVDLNFIKVKYYSDEQGHYVHGTEEAAERLGVYAFGFGETKREAFKSYTSQILAHIKWIEQKADLHDVIHPFRTGPWGSIGGKWIQCFGIFFWIRFGNDMTGGWQIPFTNINLTIRNGWRRYNEKWRSKK